ncbi:MAG: hypothetical protein KDD62_05825, partial [Bdellovibrionales bacterium]|nr:hypothetical protein [Bdellovibrionales bacterium]
IFTWNTFGQVRVTQLIKFYIATALSTLCFSIFFPVLHRVVSSPNDLMLSIAPAAFSILLCYRKSLRLFTLTQLIVGVGLILMVGISPFNQLQIACAIRGGEYTEESTCPQCSLPSIHRGKICHHAWECDGNCIRPPEASFTYRPGQSPDYDWDMPGICSEYVSLH